MSLRTKTDKKHSDAIKEASRIAWPANYHICKDLKDLGAIARAIATNGEFAFDCETDSLYWPTGNLLCISIYAGGVAYLINFAHILLPKFGFKQVADVLGQYFESDNYTKYGFNICFDAHFIERHLGIRVGYLHFDGYVGSWFQETDLLQRGLKPLCEKYLGVAGKSYDRLFGGTNWTVIDPKVAAYYACKDAELHYKLCKFFEEELDKYAPHKKLFHELDMPILNMDYQVEREGFLIDEKYIREELSDKLADQILDLQVKMKEAGLPEDVDPDSPKQLSAFLYETLGLPQFFGTSTGKFALEKLESFNPIIPLLQEYREVTKLKNSFVDSLTELLVNSRVHPNFRVTGTATSRSAMDSPNLQNQPIKVGPIIRRSFIADPGYMFGSKDLKGQELRILAHYCGGGKFGEIACSGTIYEECAATFYHVPSTELKKGDERRDNGKKAWLAMQYGAQAGKISNIFNCTKAEAKNFIDNLFNKRFPEIGQYQRAAIAFSKKNNYIINLLGRKRHLHYDQAEDKLAVMALERYAMNSPIQGTAAEQLKLAYLLCNRYLIDKGLKTRAVLRIHDEIVFKIWMEEWTPELEQMLDSIIINALPMCVPFEVTTEMYKIGEDGYSRWGVI